MTSFSTFIAKEYKDLHPGMREVYGSLEQFKHLTLANQGLTPWLETLEGQGISEGLTNDIAKAYVEECDRQPSEIPSFLAQISRLHDIELPVVEGILSEKYWQEKASQMRWRVKVIA